MTPKPKKSLNSLSKETVLDQLNKISGSLEFQQSTPLRNLLRFIVVETLEGRPENLNFRNIAGMVLEEDRDYDSHTDTYVRFHISNLRQALDRYYAGGGQNDPIKIEIPAGIYVPTFRITH